MVFPSGVPSKCLIPGCGRPARAKGLCRSHYDRQRYSGHPVRDTVIRVCLFCRRQFKATRSDMFFCSHKCRTGWWRERRRRGIPDEWNPTGGRHREEPAAYVPSIPTEWFTVDDVWAKSPSSCILCGNPLDRTLPPWDDMAGVPDWIVSPEDGGELTLDNRIIVHRACWNRKVQSA